MRVQRSRADPQPVGWEIPAAVAATWLAGAVLLLPVAQGVAGWLFAGGLVWPDSLTDSILGLAVGDPGNGVRGRDQTRLAETSAIYRLASLLEVSWAAAWAWAAVAWWRSWGPGAVTGMASRLEAEKALGRSNLRRRRTEIRPDLDHRTRRAA